MVKWRENPNAVPGTYAAVVVGGELSIVVISVEAGESWGLTGQPAWPTKSMRYHFRKEKKKVSSVEWQPVLSPGLYVHAQTHTPTGKIYSRA